MTFDLNLTKSFYPFFYQLAFLLGIIVLIVEGHKRKAHLSSWLILITYTVFLGILGSRLGTFGWKDWQLFINDGFISNFGQKSALGGFFMATLSIVFVRKILGLKNNYWDAFAFFIPILMLVQRLGCLSAGCCFGLPYNGIGSIQYVGLGFIRDHHVANKLISHSSLHTSSIHAIPIYLIIVCLLTILILFTFKKRLKNSGSLVLLSIICMTFGRFVVEFFRDPISNHSMGNLFWGIKITQWLLLGVLVFALFILKWNESRVESKLFVPDTPQPFKILVLMLVLCVLILKTHSVFSSIELAVLHLSLVMSGIQCIRELFKGKLTHFEWRNVKMVPVGFLVISVVLMSQTYHYREANDSAQTQTIIKGNALYMNQLTTQYPCIQSEQGCVGPYCANADTSKPMGPDYFAYDVGVDNYVDLGRKMDFNYGVNLQVEQFVNLESDYSNLRYNVYPFIGFDGKKYFGWRVGARMGNVFSGEPENNGKVSFLPAGKFWFGHKDYATFQVGVFDSDAAGPYSSILDLRLNLNMLKATNKKVGQLGIGYSLNNYTSSFYLQSDFNIGQNITLQPRIGQVVKTTSYIGDQYLGFMGGIGFKYNFVRQ